VVSHLVFDLGGVIVEPGHDGLNADEVISQLKTVLSGYKVRKSVVFMDELPRNAMGKVQKNVLRDALAT